MKFNFSDILNPKDQKIFLIMLLLAMLIGIPSGYIMGTRKAEAEYQELRKIKLAKIAKAKKVKEENLKKLKKIEEENKKKKDNK